MIRACYLCLVAMLLSGCIEYRLNRDGMERYISTFPISSQHKRLDPRIGPKARVWLATEDTFRPYIGGDLRDNQYLTSTIGSILYLGPDTSFEVGYRFLLYQNDTLKQYEENDAINIWDDSPSMFFFGGVFFF